MTYPHDAIAALLAARGKVLLVILLTEELALLLHEAYANEGSLAVGVGAMEVVRAPSLVHGQHKGTSEKGNSGSPSAHTHHHLVLTASV